MVNMFQVKEAVNFRKKTCPISCCLLPTNTCNTTMYELISNILSNLRYFGGFGVGYGNDPFLDEREIYPEWFEVDKADQCDDVPENVNTGRIRDVCGDVR